MNELNNTSWDNTHIYSDLDSDQFQSDKIMLGRKIDDLGLKTKSFEKLLSNSGGNSDGEIYSDENLNYAHKCKLEASEIFIQLREMLTFVSCLLSQNSKNTQAQKESAELKVLNSDYMSAVRSLDQYISLSDDDFFERFIACEGMDEFKFHFEHKRKMNPYLLNVEKEQLIGSLGQSGLHAWGSLYNKIAGSMELTVDGKVMGLAEASGLLRTDDENKRKSAFEAIQAGWTKHEDSAAAIVNSINGWRIEELKKRSYNKEIHPLDYSAHQSRIYRQTLDTLMKQTYEHRSIGQRACKLMAANMGKDTLDGWDILAAPKSFGETKSNTIKFDEAIAIIKEAFAKQSSQMADFAQMMADNNWIDAANSSYRAQGAYCTKFPKAREPRVFMTYSGTMGNVITLAHELGHAYHNWVMRDMPFIKTSYSMTLAETASIFAETLVKRDLLEKSESTEDKLSILWQDALSAQAMLNNIPTRFEFEKNFVEARSERVQSVGEMKSLMSDAWQKWYGDSLRNYDELFWASKLHFSISGLGFYNYPYLFGYLFSLGIYSQKERLGEKFNDLYIDILRDTGVMSAEDLVQKHLGVDIREAAFWNQSLNVVEENISLMEKLTC